MISNKLLKNYKKPKKWQTFRKNRRWVKNKENRIYIRGEFRESLGIIFFSPFQPEREFKVYKSCKCSQILCRRSKVH